MRATRIELAYQAWEACILPLNYARVGDTSYRTGHSILGGDGFVKQEKGRFGGHKSGGNGLVFAFSAFFEKKRAKMRQTG